MGTTWIYVRKQGEGATRASRWAGLWRVCAFCKSLRGLGPLKCHKQGSNGSDVIIVSKPPTLPFTRAREISEEQDSRQRSFVPIYEAADGS